LGCFCTVVASKFEVFFLKKIVLRWFLKNKKNIYIKKKHFEKLPIFFQTFTLHSMAQA